jgi:transmembrane sensor
MRTSMPTSMPNTLSRQQAAGWVIRLDAGALTPVEQEALDAWLASDPAHPAALARARSTWRDLDLLGTVAAQPLPAARTRERARAPHGGRAHARRARRPLAWAGACAALVLALAAAWQYPRADAWLRADARTATGESQRVPLAGGGTAQLDTASAIRVSDTAKSRGVEVLAGTVAFDVGHADARPFRVSAGDIVVNDIGTTFQVARDGDDTNILVTSGMVEVRAPGGTASVRAGENAWIAGDEAPRVSQLDTDAASAWTRGRLVFVDRPLGEVVAELNRYYDGHIIVLGDLLASRRVSGVFKTSDPLAALGVIERNLGLRARRPGLGLIILQG